MEVEDVGDTTFEKDAVRAAKEGETADLAERWRELPDEVRVYDVPVRGFDGSGAQLSDQAVADHLRERIPDRHLRRIQEIRYTGEFVPAEDGYCTQGSYDPRDNKVLINRQFEGQGPKGIVNRDAFFQTLDHEVGHHVFENLDHDAKEQWNILSRMSKPEEYVSEYAREKGIEKTKDAIHDDFAEAYSVYVGNATQEMQAEDLRARLPQKYEFMKEYVFEGREYAARHR